MSLPIDFVASATALACYQACPRRFKHRYLDGLPTAGLDPLSEERIRRGQLFHRLVLWHDLGLDTDLILGTAADPVLEAQWSAYRSFHGTLADSGADVRHDQSLVARCGGFAVQARIDALVVEPTGRVTIYDWKTAERPSRARLVESQQSKVYPYVVWEVLRRRPGSMLADPAQIRLVYWFPSHPDDPFEMSWSAERLGAGTAWLDGLLQTIASDNRFEMTGDRTRCQGCEYVAHCGVTPVKGEQLEQDEEYYLTAGLNMDPSFDHVVLPD